MTEITIKIQDGAAWAIMPDGRTVPFVDASTMIAMPITDDDGEVHETVARTWDRLLSEDEIGQVVSGSDALLRASGD